MAARSGGALHSLAGHRRPGRAVTVESSTLDVRRDLYETLTEREREVCKLLAFGRTCADIARELAISVKTAKTHRGHVLTKLRLRNVAELARDAIMVGFVPAPGEASP